MTNTLLLKSKWIFEESGRRSARDNMAIDQLSLDLMIDGIKTEPRIRFFQWEKPSITYGYLLDSQKVEKWGKQTPTALLEKRPSGGGAVYHQLNDLSFSVLWPRRKNILPEKPRDAYEIIHQHVKEALEKMGMKNLSLFVKPEGRCDTNTANLAISHAPSGRFSVCFDEPVCNDVMEGNKKIVGGALRITRKAILYQGNILLKKNTDTQPIKNLIQENFSS